MEKEITCAICHEHYTEPKVLPCCHYYCKQCIHRLTLRTGTDKPFSCPECRQDTTNLNKIEEEGTIKEESPLGEPKEEPPTGEPIKKEPPLEGPIKEEPPTGGSIKEEPPLGELIKEEPAPSGTGLIKEEPQLMCTGHDISMNIYCFTCSCLICRDCTIEDHLGHNYEEYSPFTKEMLIEHLQPLKEVERHLSHAVEEIRTTRSEIEAQGDSVANEIRGSFAELHQILERHKQELLKEAAMKVTEKLEHLSGQVKNLSTECAAVQSFIEDTEQCVEHSTDDEIMCMHDDIQSRIDREMKEHHNEGRSLEPVEEVDIGVEVNCAEDLHQLLYQN